MNVEITEFFEHERDDNRQTLKGSMNVFLCDMNIDLRFVYIIRNKNYWRFNLPGRWVKDSDTGNDVWVPTFSFLDRSKTTELLAQIREKGKVYIEQNVLNKKNALGV